MHQSHNGVNNLWTHTSLFLSKFSKDYEQSSKAQQWHYLQPFSQDSLTKKNFLPFSSPLATPDSCATILMKWWDDTVIQLWLIAGRGLLFQANFQLRFWFKVVVMGLRRKLLNEKMWCSGRRTQVLKAAWTICCTVGNSNWKCFGFDFCLKFNFSWLLIGW